MTLIIDQPAVVRADWLDGAVEATGREDLEEGRHVHVRLVGERGGVGVEGLVPRRAPEPLASSGDGGSR